MVGPPDLVTRRQDLPRDDLDWFDQNYPMRGAWTWFVQTCLAEFRARHEQTPSELIDLVVTSIHEEAQETDD